MAQTAIRTAIKLVLGVQLPTETELVSYDMQQLNAEFEQLLDAIANKDAGTVAVIYECWEVKPGGWVERVTARLMGFVPDTTRQIEGVGKSDEKS